MDHFPHLFQPIQLGPVQVRNRVMMTTHGPRLPLGRYLRYLEERARGGIGLIGISAGLGVYNEPTGPGRFLPAYAPDLDAVLPDPTTPEGIAYYDDTVIPALRKQAEAVHRHGAACVGQVLHLGAAKHQDNYRPAVAPSAVVDEYDRHVPHELDEEEIAHLVAAFGHAARRVKEAGMDGVEVHGAHGYLFQQFLSPLTNLRTDGYGGSLERRLRFLIEVLDAIRVRVGPRFLVGLRINGDEFAEGGLTNQDIVEVARRVEGRLGYLNISGGNYTGLKRGLALAYVAPWYVPPGPNVPMAAAVKKAVRIPVIVAGKITDPAQAERILAEGAADMVGMTRAFIADPHFVQKALEGKADDIRRCVGANECHFPGRQAVCMVNAAAGREEELDFAPASVPRRVLVIGGGPAGLEAARVAALRGHRVTLWERSDTLGGQLRVIARDPNRANLLDFLHWLERQDRGLGVEVRLQMEAAVDSVAAEGADVVLVATGSATYVPPVPVTGPTTVVTDLAVLQGRVPPGRRVLVVGGLEDHLAPPTVAELLAGQGKQVEVITELLTVGEGVEPATLYLLTKRLLEKGVVLTPLTALKAIEHGAVVVENTLTRRERRIPDVDAVVLACGRRANDALARALKGRLRELHLVGDCRAPRRIVHAVLEAARLASVL